MGVKDPDDGKELMIENQRKMKKLYFRLHISNSAFSEIRGH